MNAERCYAELLSCVKRLGITVHYHGSGPSGLCVFKGERVFFIDTKQPLEARIAVLVKELRKADLRGIFLVPGIRRLLESEYETDWDKGS